MGQSYANPLQNLSIKKNHSLLDKLPIEFAVKVTNSAKAMIFFRPYLSLRKPLKYRLVIMPEIYQIFNQKA
jgi:hypothetical protein